MKKIRNQIGASLAIAMLVVGLSACQKEGPMERAGKEIDKSVQSAGQQLDKAGQKIQDSAQGNKWPGT